MNLSNELTKQVKAHLDDVRKYLGALPADERQEILQSIESHIYAALETRSDGTPTPELLDAVIAEMDPPESYGELRPPSRKRSLRLPVIMLVLVIIVSASAWIIWVNGPKPIGRWVNVAFVRSIEAFVPHSKGWIRDHPLMNLTVYPDGKTDIPGLTWKNRHFHFSEFNTNAKFFIKDISGQDCLFIEWKGNANESGLQPMYYVFKKYDLDPAKYSQPVDIHLYPIGQWVSVDFVSAINQFDPDSITWTNELELKEIVFLKEGKTDKPFWRWEGNVLHHSGDNTNAKFYIYQISGTNYLFLEWMSDDVIHGGLPPKYYVLKKTNDP